MSIYSDKLKEMIEDADPQADRIDSNLSQIQEQIDATQEQADAVEFGMCNVAANDLLDYLNNVKLPDIQTTHPDAYLEVGPTYGDIDYVTGNITDWQILEPESLDDEIVLYEYEGVGWDGDTTITKLVNDFAFGNDYLEKPYTATPYSSYGLNPTIQNLNRAKSILTQNKNKIVNSKTYFEDYAS